MKRLPGLGLRSRIIIALATVMALFILLTELSISKLVRVAMSRQPAAAEAVESETGGRDTLEKDLRNLRRLTVFYLVTGALVALFLGAIAVNRLAVKPLGRITRAVEQVAGGDLKIQVPIAGSGELIRLGVAFNQMTGTLREQQDELKNRLNQLEQSTEALKETQNRLIQTAKLASVGTLAAGVAHEIGNPLAGVLGLLEALDVEEDKATAGSYRALMRKEIKRIDRIINDLLVYARPVEYDPDKKVSCEVGEIVEHVLGLLGAQKLFDKITIETSLAGGPWSVMIGHDDLTQVLINLLLNAAQAMDGPGGIQLSAERLTGWRPGLGVVAREAVRVSVTDTGPGVPEESADRIFDPFYSQRKNADGFGLGLAICQSICNRVGGEIALDRDYAGGSRFEITLLSA
jgi:two-component system NtrC family sensor kinase